MIQSFVHGLQYSKSVVILDSVSNFLTTCIEDSQLQALLVDHDVESLNMHIFEHLQSTITFHPGPKSEKPNQVCMSLMQADSPHLKHWQYFSIDC